MTIGTVAMAIIAGVALLGTAIWSVASNASGLRSLEDKHNTFASRVGEDLRRLEKYIDNKIDELRNRPAPRR
jgi:hypothetical protein